MVAHQLSVWLSTSIDFRYPSSCRYFAIVSSCQSSSARTEINESAQLWEQTAPSQKSPDRAWCSDPQELCSPQDSGIRSPLPRLNQSLTASHMSARATRLPFSMLVLFLFIFILSFFLKKEGGQVSCLFPNSLASNVQEAGICC